MALRVIIDWGPVRDLLLKLESKPRIDRETKEDMADRLVEIMTEEAPRGLTGMLKELIYAEISDSTIKVVPWVYYAYFVESGTRASSGRYFPTLKSDRAPGYPGARLVLGARSDELFERSVREGWAEEKLFTTIEQRIGIHPGTPANPFVFRTRERFVKEELEWIMEDYLWKLFGR